MTLSRRKFLLVSAGATAAVAPLAHAAARLAQQAGQQSGQQPGQPTTPPQSPKAPPAAAATESFLEWRTLKPGFTAGLGAGGNSLVIFDKGEATLIDTKFSWLGPQLRREANAVKRITQVINTHHHADHSGGNNAFSTDLAVLAHDNAKPRILAQTQQYVTGTANGRKELAERKGQVATLILNDIAEFEKNAAAIKPEAWAPTKTVSDGHELKIGGIPVVLRHFGAGHTDNDLVVVFPEHNIIHVGDLVLHQVYPYFDRPAKANTKGWINSLNQVMKLCKDDTIVIPGHGDISDKACLSEQIKYFEDMLVFVRDQIKAGKSRDEITKMNPAPYDKYSFPWIRAISLGGIYDEIKEQG